jgi:hypothetical protein
MRLLGSPADTSRNKEGAAGPLHNVEVTLSLLNHACSESSRRDRWGIECLRQSAAIRQEEERSAAGPTLAIAKGWPSARAEVAIGALDGAVPGSALAGVDQRWRAWIPRRAKCSARLTGAEGWC